ncbi:MAG: TonB-dependent receptor P3 [Parabacteroides sp.]
MEKSIGFFFSFKRFFVGSLLSCMLITEGKAASVPNLSNQRFDIEFSMNNATLKNVVNSLKKQTDILFSYDIALETLRVNNVSIKVKDAPLETIFEKVFRGTEIGYKIEDHIVVFYSKSEKKSTKTETGQQQHTKTVSGIVKDAAGEPVIGANVIEKGTTNGVITGVDGEFTLEVPDNAVLEVSYIGYLSHTVHVKNKSTFNIILREDTQKLDEVVVLGYGDSRKKDLSMAVSSIKMDSEIKSRPGGLEGLLQGKLPGVTISNNGGDPLANPTVTIRGQGSRSSDKVLYIVDGVPGAPFNTEDVESISVLKDAASAAIYGAHVGSGGVIVVTTKQAQSGKPKVDANVYYGFQNATNLPKMLTAEDYVRVRTDAANASGMAVPSGLDPDLYPYGQVTRTDWLDEIFRTSSVQHYAASITGGSDNLKAFASVSYDKQEGILINTYKETLGARMNIEFKINDWLTFTQRANYVHTNGQGDVNTSSHTGVIAQAMFMPRSATVYEYDREGNPVMNSSGQHAYGGTVPLWAKDLGVAGTFGEVQNPVAKLERLRQYRPDQRIFSTSTFTIKPITGLTIKSDFSVGSRHYQFQEFTMKVPEIGKPNDQNSKSIENTMEKNWLWETVATYSCEFKDKHLLSVMGGYTMGYNNYRDNKTVVYNFPYEENWAQDFVNGTNWSKEKPTELFTEESQISAFGRASYSFADRYFLTGSLRYDATSKLFKRSDVFPAVSGAWKISSEPFFKDALPVVSLFKLRASWGQIGNIASVGPYAYNVKLSASPWFTYFGNIGQNAIKGVSLRTFQNLNLVWETSQQTDLGFDLNLLDDKLAMTVDYFIKDTKDLIEEMTVPSVAGIETAPLGNVGKVRNSGWEIGVNWNDRAGAVSYSIGANFSTLKNEVKSLGDRDYIPHTNEIRSMMPLRSAVGQSWYSYYLIPTDGLFRSNEEAEAYVKDGQRIQPNAKAGDIKFKDTNNDGIINDKDRVYMGSYMPKYTFALNGSVSWNNFDVSFQFQGVAGNKIFNGVKVMTYPSDQGFNMSTDVLDSYSYNPLSNIPRLAMKDENKNYSTVSDFFLENGSYLRMKNLTIGYSLPKSLMASIGCSGTNVRFYATGENLFTITKYSGIDPEVGGNGLDGGKYPVARVFSLGLNVNF